jgi:hypothetical protein
LRLRQIVLGSALLLSSATSLAQESASPAPSSVAPARDPGVQDEPHARFRTSFDVGPAFFADSRSTQRFGLALESNTMQPLGGQWGVGVRFTWGMTEFERFERWAGAGYKIGKWTTHAYADVAKWSVKKDDYVIFKLMASMFAYVGLMFPLMIAGICYVGAVAAPTTFLEVNVTANRDFGSGRVGPFLEAGLGLNAFVHPKYGNLRGGLGPVLGGGLRAGPVRLGTHVTWSPPPLHGEPGSGHIGIFTGAFTVGIIGG